MFRVPAPHEHGTVLHCQAGSAVVLDGYAVHEDGGALIQIAAIFGLQSVEPVPAVDEPAPAPVVEPHDNWADDGGAVHHED
jgi:hypothetical protein